MRLITLCAEWKCDTQRSMGSMFCDKHREEGEAQLREEISSISGYDSNCDGSKQLSIPVEPNVNRIQLGERTYTLSMSSTDPVDVRLSYSRDGVTYTRQVGDQLIPLRASLDNEAVEFKPPPLDQLALIGATSYDDLPHHLLCSRASGGRNRIGALTCSCRRFWGLESKPRCVAGECRNPRQPGHALCSTHLGELRP